MSDKVEKFSFGPEWERVAAELVAQAEKFGREHRMLKDGTIVPVETYEALRTRWHSSLP